MTAAACRARNDPNLIAVEPPFNPTPHWSQDTDSRPTDPRDSREVMRVLVRRSGARGLRAEVETRDASDRAVHGVHGTAVTFDLTGRFPGPAGPRRVKLADREATAAKRARTLRHSVGSGAGRRRYAASPGNARGAATAQDGSMTGARRVDVGEQLYGASFDLQSRSMERVKGIGSKALSPEELGA